MTAVERSTDRVVTSFVWASQDMSSRHCTVTHLIRVQSTKYSDSPLPLFVLVGLLVDLDDLPLGVLLRPEHVGVRRGTHPAVITFAPN